jgi:hypothetical protein
MRKIGIVTDKDRLCEVKNNDKLKMLSKTILVFGA